MKFVSMLTALAFASLVGACATAVPERSPSGLKNTEWVLIGFQGAGTDELHEVQLYKYTMQLGSAGQARFKLDCNVGSSSWEARARDPSGGTLTFGPIAATTKLCEGLPVAIKIENFGAYSTYDGRLSISEKGSGRIWVWDSVD